MAPKDIISREEYIDKLYLWWERTKVKSGTTVIIKGEPGVGKTTLADKFLEIIKKEDCFIIRAEGFEEEIGPLVPFIDAIKRFIDEKHRELTIEFLIKYVTNLCRIIPNLHTVLESAQYTKKQFIEEKISSYIPSKEVQIFFDIFSFFEGLSKKKPVVLFVEDIQWLDESSKKLLYYFIKRVGENKIFILSTYRTHYITSEMEERADQFVKKLETKGKDERIETITLDPIEKKHYARLIEILLCSPHEFTSSEIDFLHTQTEGNPKFLEQVLNLFEEAGIISKKGGRYIFIQPPTNEIIPTTIEATIKARLDKIYNDLPPSKELLEFASAIGLKFHADKLEGITEKPLKEIIDILTKIERKYYLVKRCQKIIQYMFDHKKTQEVIYNTLGDIAPDVHRQIASYLEKKNQISPYPIAYHYKRGLNYTKADEYFQKSAHKAFEEGQFEDAVVFSEECISLEKNFLKKEPDISILILYSEALFLSYNIEKALQELLEIYNNKKYNLEPVLQARIDSLIGKCYYIDGRDELVEKSFCFFNEAIEKYKTTNNIEKLIETYFDIAASYDHIGKYESSKAFIQKALELTDKTDNPITSAIAFRRSYISDSYLASPQKLDRTIEIFEKHGKRRELGRLLNNLGVEYLELGLVEKAKQNLTKSLLLFEQERVFEQDFPANNLGVVEIINENYGVAQDLLNIALSYHSEEFNRISIMTNLAYLKARTEDISGIENYISKVIKALQHFHDPLLKEKCYTDIGIIYYIINEYEQAFNFISKAIDIDTSQKKKLVIIDDDLTEIKMQIMSEVCRKTGKEHPFQHIKRMTTQSFASEKIPLFRLSGYYPCLIAFYY